MGNVVRLKSYKSFGYRMLNGADKLLMKFFFSLSGLNYFGHTEINKIKNDYRR